MSDFTNRNIHRVIESECVALLSEGYLKEEFSDPSTAEVKERWMVISGEDGKDAYIGEERKHRMKQQN